jgi:hypothetical protein
MDRNAEFPKPTDMMPNHSLLLTLIKNWRLLILVGLSGAENLIGENQQCVGDSHDSP